jgi:Domain of unknown function (DUF4337)
MSEAHERAESAEHVAHSDKRIALLISIIALFLALSETLGKGAQTEAISETVKANDLWAFYQAKVIRLTTLRTAGAAAEFQIAATPDPEVRAKLQNQIDDWRKTAARYESDPETGEGRKELQERAQEVEHERDIILARYHNYEIASAAFQMGIVLASASVITGMIVLTWLSGGIAVVGLVFTGLGLLSPTLVNF